jgi:branched-chain amino acid transport system ATP-binding protein
LIISGLLAADDLNFEVPRGRILSPIGPNRAGKTTVFNMTVGIYPPSDGTIRYKGDGSII